VIRFGDDFITIRALRDIYDGDEYFLDYGDEAGKVLDAHEQSVDDVFKARLLATAAKRKQTKKSSPSRIDAVDNDNDYASSSSSSSSSPSSSSSSSNPMPVEFRDDACYQTPPRTSSSISEEALELAALRKRVAQLESKLVRTCASDSPEY
jgi:hypothetical protein